MESTEAFQDEINKIAASIRCLLKKVDDDQNGSYLRHVCNTFMFVITTTPIDRLLAPPIIISKSMSPPPFTYASFKPITSAVPRPQPIQFKSITPPPAYQTIHNNDNNNFKRQMEP